MKIALLISGYLRGFYENIESIRKNIIHNNECDIYIHITSYYKDDKYINKHLSLDFINEKLNPKIIIVSSNLVLSTDNAINNVLNQNYKFSMLNDERVKIMNVENITYDVVIKIRPDIHFLSKFDFNNLGTNIYIPTDSKMDCNRLTHVGDKYICDMVAYGCPDVMTAYFNYYHHLIALIHKYNTTINETLLYYYLYENNIPYELVELNFHVILSLCNTIAITGDSGSGKTTISTILKNLFSNSFILECDRYHKWERTNENWNVYSHLNPDANYITKMYDDVFDLKIGNEIYQVEYDHTNGKFTDKKKIESSENLIVCGLHCLYLPEEIFNLKIYMDTDDNLRIPWKIKRDIQKRGYSIDNIMQQIKKRNEDFKKYIYPQKKTADIIINLYTDIVFDISTFDIASDLNTYLKIGVKNTYNINNLSKKIGIKNIVHDEYENFVFLYFENIYDFEYIIRAIVLNSN